MALTKNGFVFAKNSIDEFLESNTKYFYLFLSFFIFFIA